jgi:uncharacterized circularly permuted ATP-grasp superfamily protein
MVRPADPIADASYDEAYAAPGVARPHYAALLDALADVDLAALRDDVNARIDRAGVRFATGEDDAFVVDPIPRILTAAEWDALAAGLEQRVRALNAFVLDAYGPRRIVEAGHMAGEVIDSAEGYEPELRGRFPAAVPIGVAGLDIVRAPDGTMTVLEDNVRTPSGFTYALAARRAVRDALPHGVPDPVAAGDEVFGLLGGVLSAAAQRIADDPFAVVLTDGEDGGAAWEHAEIARGLGAPLVTCDDLEHRGGRLVARLEDGRRRPVDVVYRRTDEDGLRDARGAPTAVGAALLEPWLQGSVAVVNAFGTGVADDKLVHGHVREMIRFYLGEEPLAAAVPTLDLGRADDLEAVLGDLRGHVVKPRFGHGGAGVVVCAHADDRTLERVRDQLTAAPEGFVAQPLIAISSHPTVIGDGRLEPRHVDLRPFLFATDVKMGFTPGGLTRVAWDAGALVVNSSQNGGAKDTWVLRPSR